MISYKGVFQLIELNILDNLKILVRGKETHWFGPSTNSYIGTKEECEIVQERYMKNKIFNSLFYQTTINGSNNDT